MDVNFVTSNKTERITWWLISQQVKTKQAADSISSSAAGLHAIMQT